MPSSKWDGHPTVVNLLRQQNARSFLKAYWLARNSRAEWIELFQMGSSLLYSTQVVVKPVCKNDQIGLDASPAVLLAFLDNQFGVGARLLGALDEAFGLLDWDQLVGVAMDDQRSRQIGGHVVDG